MGWTYAPEDLDTNRMMQVRVLVGDTDPADPLLQDEEIDLMLLMYPPVATKPPYLAAAAACDAIAMKFGRLVDKTIGELQRSLSQKFDHYMQLARLLREQYQTAGVGSKVSGAPMTVAAPVLGGGGRTVLGGW